MLALTVLIFSNAQIRQALTARDQALGDLQAQEQETRAAEREKTLQLAMARWTEARALRQTRQRGQRLHSLDALAETVRRLQSLNLLEPHKLELRNDAIACLRLPDLRKIANGPDPRGRWTAFDSTCHHYAHNEGPGILTVQRVEDGAVVHRWQWKGDRCSGLTFGFNDRLLVAVCDDNVGRGEARCRVWSMADGQLVLERMVWARSERAFRLDGQVLALPRADGSLALYDLIERRDLSPLPLGPLPEHIRFHPDGRHLAVSFGAEQPAVHVWDVVAGKVVLQLAGPGRSGVPAWSPDGRLLAVGGADTNVYLFEFPSGNRLAVLRGHEAIIIGLAFHPSGELLVSTSHDDTTRFWRLPSSAELVLDGEVGSSSSADGGRMVTRSYHSTVTIWEVNTASDVVRTLVQGSTAYGNKAGPVPGELAFAPDNRLLATASQDGVLLWDTAAARLVGRVPSGPGHSLAFHPQGHWLFTPGPGGLMQWPIVPVPDSISAPHRAALRIGPGKTLWPMRAAGESLRVHSDGLGKLLLLAEIYREMRLLPLAEPAKANLLGTHDGVSWVALSPDGRWAVSAPVNGDATIRVWDTARAKVVRQLPQEEERYFTATFSPDGRWLVTNVRSEFRFWEVGSWEVKQRLPRHWRSLHGYVAFAGDGRLLALAYGRDVVHLHDTGTWQHLASLETPGRKDVTGLALSPDGSRLAIATADGALGLWDLRRLRERLAALGLDWDLPAYPSAERESPPVEAMQVEILSAAGTVP
jgi:WD40 repeat protein